MWAGTASALNGLSWTPHISAPQNWYFNITEWNLTWSNGGGEKYGAAHNKMHTGHRCITSSKVTVYSEWSGFQCFRLFSTFQHSNWSIIKTAESTKASNCVALVSRVLQNQLSCILLLLRLCYFASILLKCPSKYSH